MAEKKWMKKPEIAEHFGVSINTGVSWIDSGMPEYRPAGGHPIYDVEEVEAWLKKQKKGEG